MANSKNLVNLRIETKFVDEEGNEILVTQYSEETAENVDESVSTVKRAENVILSSGESYNPSMSAGARPVLMVGLCVACLNERPFWPWRRGSRAHPLCNVRHLKHCLDCGRAVCPKHRKRSTYDKKERCFGCHRKHRRSLWLSWLFFEEVDR
jgi:hypothetical protein